MKKYDASMPARILIVFLIVLVSSYAMIVIAKNTHLYKMIAAPTPVTIKAKVPATTLRCFRTMHDLEIQAHPDLCIYYMLGMECEGTCGIVITPQQKP